MAEAFYFEDFVVGTSAESPGRTLTETDLLHYAGLTGDWEAGASDSNSSRLPDLLPLCVSSGLTWRLPVPPPAILAFRGLEWNFLQPLRVGDTVRFRATALAKRAAPEGGVVIERREILNQRNEVVQLGKVTYLVARRPPR